MLRSCRYALLSLLLLQAAGSAEAAVVIPSHCGSFGRVTLRISDRDVGPVPGAPSVVNYASQLNVQHPAATIAGTTSIFWGGIAKWFTSSDGRYRYRADLGVSGGEMLKRIVFSSPKGTVNCRLVEP